MEIKKKDMQNTWFKDAKKKTYFTDDINIKGITGITSLTIWNEVSKPLTINYPYGDTKIIDNNYKWVQIALENQNYWLTAMYDENDNFIQIYIDITLKNNLEDKTNPYFYDLFNDIVIMPYKYIYVADEKELKQAYEKNLINKIEYDFASRLTKKIYDYVLQNQDNIIKYCYLKLQELKSKIN